MNEIQKTDLPRATHAGVMRFGDVKIPCYVLSDGRALILKTGVLSVITGRSIGVGTFDVYFDAIPNKPADFAVQWIPFITAGSHRAKAQGITAQQFAEIISLYASAFADGKLKPSQAALGARCSRIAVALMKVGITAMVYEAAGYAVGARKTLLQEKIEQYLLPAANEWERMFPAEFYIQWCRLYEHPYDPKRPPRGAAWFQRQLVYDFLDVDVAREQSRRNPRPAWGHLHHQLWTEDARHLLRVHINQLIALMTASRTKHAFRRAFEQFFARALDKTAA